MKWEVFLSRFNEQPLFHSSMLAVFDEPVSHIQVQLSRWVRQGKLSQIRRGWYLIKEPFRNIQIPPPKIANQVVHPSYLSLEWALSYHGMIPEYVPNLTSVTTQRAVRFTFDNRGYIYRYLKPSFFKGYSIITLDGQNILIAKPEKALLDRIYLFLQNNCWSMDWVSELRLQNLEDFNSVLFESFGKGSQMKNLEKAIDDTIIYIDEERK